MHTLEMGYDLLSSHTMLAFLAYDYWGGRRLVKKLVSHCKVKNEEKLRFEQCLILSVV